ncbi:hypothetical protein PoB_006692500 [Plakobranchus ocellatus]|uniref:Uncharacterized protein n=1 Tax=Plakobranchus ocellatus TaxID=259542 RepID=A0AAV4D8H1_9GAST|nr:hypothetical protein PoB_006692500 [Plakobranchus ocellatus]
MRRGTKGRTTGREEKMREKEEETLKQSESEWTGTRWRWRDQDDEIGRTVWRILGCVRKDEGAGPEDRAHKTRTRRARSEIKLWGREPQNGHDMRETK